MAAPDVIAAEAELDYARDAATAARELARVLEEQAATALTGYNEALRAAQDN